MSGIGRLRQEDSLKLYASWVKQKQTKTKTKTDRQMDRWTVVTRSPRTEPQGRRNDQHATSDDSSVPGDRRGSARHVHVHGQDREGRVLSGGSEVSVELSVLKTAPVT